MGGRYSIRTAPSTRWGRWARPRKSLKAALSYAHKSLRFRGVDSAAVTDEVTGKTWQIPPQQERENE